MPLPKAPNKPATLLDMTTVPAPRASRAAGGRGPGRQSALTAVDTESPDAPQIVSALPMAATAAGAAPEPGLAAVPTDSPQTAAAPARSRNRRGNGAGSPVAATESAAAPAPRAKTGPHPGRGTAPSTSAGEKLSTPERAMLLRPSVLLAPDVPVLPTPQVTPAPQPAPKPAATTPDTVHPAATAAAVGARPHKSGSREAGEQSKLFVVDTNVLMHDPSSLFRFAEHDVYLPMMTLEELDNHKRGMSEVARNARQVSRSLDSLVAATHDGQIDQGIDLNLLGNQDAGGRLFFQTQAVDGMLPSSLPVGKADNQILGVVRSLQDDNPGRDVVLVSKDINMRIKARALGLRAEDYFNDQVLEDTDLLYSGMLQLPDNFWDKHGKGIESWQQAGVTYYRISGPLVGSFLLNQFVYLDGELPLVAQVKELNGRTAVLQTLRDFAHHKNAVWGVTARNREQNFALNLLMNPEIDFVSLLGQAGTGKTLLTLAAGLAQTIEGKRFSEIIMTRATVPVGDDIGYLPGTEEEKMQPWMGALEDNLEVLNQGDPAGGEWGRQATNDIIRSRVKVKALSFMRGRTFINKFLIIDEAQNLTPKQMKTLVTRAGPGTKVVCLGNIAQIDTPYLTEGSSGLTYVVDRFKGWAHAGHVTLQRGERSRLADFAAEAL